MGNEMTKGIMHQLFFRALVAVQAHCRRPKQEKTQLKVCKKKEANKHFLTNA